MLELTDLARRYGDVVALDGISFSVAPGQLYGFVGPNGGQDENPDGTLAHVSALIPFTAPTTLRPRILVGAAPWYEVVGGALVTLAAAAALIPLAARICSGAVLRTGSAIKLRDAWRARSPAH